MILINMSIIILYSLFFLITHSHSSHHSHNIKANETDLQALLAIKAKISNDPRSILTSWNHSFHFCEWEGVTCGHRHRRVVTLDLSASNLVGTLSPFIGNLSFLHELDIGNNSFRGGIPNEISLLPRLRILALSRNSFEGGIPTNLSRCSNLLFLELDNNKLEGRIPSEVVTLPNLGILGLYNNHFSGHLKDIRIANMSSSLQILYLNGNQLHGSIPDDFGRLKDLFRLALSDNLLSGIIPTSVYNLSNLNELDLSRNKINGNLPGDLGLCFPQLQYLLVSKTSLVGQVPMSLSNLSELITLELSSNTFKGEFSFNGNNMPNLMHLNIGSAFSSGEATNLGFVDTLTNCTNLVQLLIGGNSFIGSFPLSILNLSTNLQLLNLGENEISGYVPFGLGRFVNIYALGLMVNHFTGPIPSDISKLQSIELLYFTGNNFSGEISSEFGNLTLLSDLRMDDNNLEGSLPTSLGDCKNLQYLYLSSNKLNGVLPVEVFHAESLIVVYFDQNNFQGSLPNEISMLNNLVELSISDNRFSGEIPGSLGGCTSLTILDMSKNSIVGQIPNSLSPLKSIQTLDLSRNHLSGEIPNYFTSWPYLSNLNLSFNDLEGEVPTNGVFANMSEVSVVGNRKLCGGVFELHLERCPSPKRSKRRRLSLALILIISVSCVLIGVSVIVLCFYFLCSQRKRKDTSSGLELINPFLEVSYQMLLRATNGFSASNLIGVGGFGSVYKGILHQDDTESIVAVKVMKLQNEGAGKSFLAECKALRNIRHRNLVKIITACSSIDTQRNDFKALIYEFIPRGSLEGWLYQNHLIGDDQFCSLSLLQRLNIVIDVASALEYLHTGCADPIIHCDLKPSNILLDDEMTAHVGDFGLAKFLSGASTSSTTNQTSSTQVRGTVGYAAPEYGIGSKASMEGDIYSFGIVVLETMTSKKPTEPMFSEGLNLHEFVKAAFPDRVMETIDQRMLGDANILRAITAADIREIECIKSLVMVGVKCSLELPQDRMSINDVVNELKSARKKILPTLKRNYRPMLNSS